jgi:hypothetical protein
MYISNIKKHKQLLQVSMPGRNLQGIGTIKINVWLLINFCICQLRENKALASKHVEIFVLCVRFLILLCIAC